MSEKMEEFTDWHMSMGPGRDSAGIPCPQIAYKYDKYDIFSKSGYPTPCSITWEGYHCTQVQRHPGPHIASSHIMGTVCAVWHKGVGKRINKGTTINDTQKFS